MSAGNDHAGPDGDSPSGLNKTGAENNAAFLGGNNHGELTLVSAGNDEVTSATGDSSREDNVNDKLIRAILKRDLQLVKDAISAGANVNYMVKNPRDNHCDSITEDDRIITSIGRTPLGIAVLAKNIKIVQELVEASADINFRVPPCYSDDISYYDTALQMATRTGQIEVVKLLLNHSADTTVMCKFNGFTPVHQAFNSALASENFDIVRVLIKYLPDVDIRDREFQTPLHCSASRGDKCIDIVRELTSRHANVNSQDKNGFTPLHGAADTGSESGNTIAFLLANGAEIEMKDKSGQTPLHVAAERLKAASIKILVQSGADINARDSKWRTPLHLATKSAEKWRFSMKNDDILETIKVLIECKADVRGADKSGQTALHFLSLMDVSNVECLNLLAMDDGILNAQDSCGRTALHYSACLGFHHVVNVFLSCGNIDVNIRDSSGCIPLHCAIPVGREETIRDLLAAGSNIHSLDNSGKSVLHLSAIYGHCNLIRLFIEGGLDPNCTDKDGRNSLHFAVLYRQEEAVKTLLGKNADSEKKDLRGLIPKDYLHPCEKMSLTYRILCGDPVAVNIPVFCLSDENRFSPPVTEGTPNLSEVSSIPGVGDVGNIVPFDMNNFVCQIRTRIKEIMYKALPKLGDILEPDSTKCTKVIQRNEQMMSNPYLFQQALFEIKEQMSEMHTASIIGCGSSSESSKVGLPDELDFLVKIFYSGNLESSQNQEGYANMVSHMDFISKDRINESAEHAYSVWLWNRLMTYWIEQQTMSPSLSAEKGQFLMPLPPQRFPDRTTCVTWVWLYNDNTFNMLPVSIDLVPAVLGHINDKKKSKSTWLMTQEEVKRAGAYLVPKIPHPDSKVFNQFGAQDQKELGRISFPHLEVMHIANLDKRVKNVYVTAKCLRKAEICGFKVKNRKGEILPVGDFVTSYRLKTVFLHLVQMFLQTNFSLGRMVLIVYEQLEACLERDFLPVFFDSEMNVLAGSKLSTEDSLRVARVMTGFVRSLYLRDFQADLESDSLEETKAKAMMPCFLPKKVVTDDAK